MDSRPPQSTRGELTKARQLTAAFRDRIGREASGVWAAPGRVNLIGEHTDYNDGYVLPFAIAQCAFAAAAPRDDGVLNLVSAQHGEARVELATLSPGSLAGWPAYVAGAVWALVSGHRVPVSGLDLLLDSDVPSGAGLSSSAAVECVTSLAVADLFGASLDPIQLALSAQRAEVEMAGVPCGNMDQIASMCGGSERALFVDCRSLKVESVPLPLERAGYEALVIDTCAPHRLVGGEYAARRRDCEGAAAALGVPALRDATRDQVENSSQLDPQQRRRARHVVSENLRVLSTVEALEQGALERIGPLLTASHASLRDDFEVTVPELNVAVQAAVDGGALGARMIGGGFGGSVLALIRGEDRPRVERAILAAFANEGFAPPRCFVAQASRGARRLLLG